MFRVAQIALVARVSFVFWFETSLASVAWVFPASTACAGGLLCSAEQQHGAETYAISVHPVFVGSIGVP